MTLRRCAECGRKIPPHKGRGRPRKRCVMCSPKAGHPRLSMLKCPCGARFLGRRHSSRGASYCPSCIALGRRRCWDCREMGQRDELNGGQCRPCRRAYETKRSQQATAARRRAKLSRPYVTATEVADSFGLDDQTVRAWAQLGQLPIVACRPYLFDIDVVGPLLCAKAVLRAQSRDSKKCTVCRRVLENNQFLMVKRRGGTRGYPSDTKVYTSRSPECRECRKEQRVQWRIRKAVASGKRFRRRADWAAEISAREEAHKRDVVRRARERARRRSEKANAPVLRCYACKRLLPRADFHPSELHLCKSCTSVRDREKFQRDREALTDRYVKRQISKNYGLPAKEIPPVMVEAKRVHLLLQRLVAPRRRT